jgi:hypothetical protein
MQEADRHGWIIRGKMAERVEGGKNLPSLDGGILCFDVP